MRSRYPLRRKLFSAAALVAATVVGRTSFAAYGYTVTDIGSALNGDSYTSQALGLNSSDQVVGYYYTTAASSTTQTAFVYNLSGGSVSQVAGLSFGGTTQALGINDAGVVVGENTQPGFNTGGFYATPANYGVGATSAALLPIATLSGGTGTILYGIGNDKYNTSAGAATTLGTATTGAANRGIVFNTTNLNPAVNIGDGFSGPVSSTNNFSTHANFAKAINASGVVAGYGYSSTTGLTDAYVATPTATVGNYTYTDIGTLVQTASAAVVGGITYSSSQATAINQYGDVVGTYTNGPTTESYFYNASSVAIFTNPFSSSSIRFTGINDLNQIVGYANNVPVPGDGSITLGFELDESTGTYTLLDNIPTGVAGQYYQVSQALGINDNGDITGYGITSGTGASSTSRALLLTGETAVPEPASLGLLGIGAITLGRRRARRAV